MEVGSSRKTSEAPKPTHSLASADAAIHAAKKEHGPAIHAAKQELVQARANLIKVKKAHDRHAVKHGFLLERANDPEKKRSGPASIRLAAKVGESSEVLRNHVK